MPHKISVTLTPMRHAFAAFFRRTAMRRSRRGLPDQPSGVGQRPQPRSTPGQHRADREPEGELHWTQLSNNGGKRCGQMFLVKIDNASLCGRVPQHAVVIKNATC